jgi:hypothetical protein
MILPCTEARFICIIVMIRLIDGYSISDISARSISGDGGKKDRLRVSVFWAFDAASPSSMGIYMLIEMELRYLFTFHISSSSASSTNVCHVFHLESLSLCQRVF